MHYKIQTIFVDFYKARTSISLIGLVSIVTDALRASYHRVTYRTYDCDYNLSYLNSLLFYYNAD